MKVDKLFLLIGLSLVCFSTSILAVQRMGLLKGGSTRISVRGSGTLSTVCLDEHDVPPTTDTRYINVMNASSPNSVIVEIDGQEISLQKSLDDRLVSISGISSPYGTEAYIDEVRINNLSGKPISVRVTEAVVLGTTRHKAFDYDVTKLLKENADQEDVWKKQPDLAFQHRASSSAPDWLAADGAARKSVHQQSTKDMRLFHFSSRNGKVELTFPDSKSVSLSQEEVEALKSGKPLPSNHPLSQRFSDGEGESHVLYSDAKLETNGTYVKDRNALAFGLQAAYPKASIFRDPLSDQTSVRAKKLNEFKVAGAKDLLVVIPDDSIPDAQIPYQRTITNIRENLKKANVEIKQFKVGMVYDGKEGRAIFVITGHSSEQLAKFVHQLGEAGFFRDNYVVLNSCGVGYASALVAEINSKYGAVGTFSFQGEIRAAAVQDYMLDLVERLTGTEPKRFVPLLIDSARRKGLFGIFTISMLKYKTKTTTKEG